MIIMDNSLIKAFEYSVAVFAFVAGLTIFLMMNDQLITYQRSVEEAAVSSSYRDDKVLDWYDRTVSGADMVNTIFNDMDSIRFLIYDSAAPPNLILDITDCSSLADLTMISMTGTYSIEYTIINSTIKEIKYSEE